MLPPCTLLSSCVGLLCCGSVDVENYLVVVSKFESLLAGK